jgi:tetratricopeptide (TPR) repeat protein
LLREAKSADPTVPGLLDRLSELLTHSANWAELADTYQAAIEHAPNARMSIDIAPKLARLYREQLGDAPKAAAVLARAADVDTENADLRRSLVDLHQSGGDLKQAIEHCRKLVQADPENRDNYRRAYRLFDRAGELDGAWNAAAVLDQLGEADINESLLAAAHRPEGLLPARTNLSETDWSSRLLYPERDVAVDDVLIAISDAAIEVGLGLAKKKNRLIDLETGILQDPQTSTATLAKTLLWASRLLGVKMPELYVMPEVPRQLAAAPSREPTAVAARTLASGLSLPELAFLWGRHLAGYRPEHYLLVFYPTVEELVPLLLSALGIGGSPAVDPRLMDQDVKKLASALKRQLRGPAMDRLREAAASVNLQGPNHAMRAWVRSVELASARAGLLACGSIEIAARLSKRFPFGSEVAPDKQIADLMAYSVSREYGELRARLGVKLIASSFPP